jgi:hypothetical protein
VPVNVNAVSEDAESPYQTYLRKLPGEPTSDECEVWARRHPDDPEMNSALMDAAYQASFDADYERSLKLFREVKDTRGEYARNAWVEAAGQLFHLTRAEDAAAELASLREELLGAPTDEPGVAEVYADTAALLDRQETDSAEVIAWCEEGLARFPAGDLASLDDDSRDERGRLLMLRRELREEAGHDADAWDGEAAREDERVREEMLGMLNELAQARAAHPGIPDDGVAYNAVVLHWPENEFAAVRERWPEAGELYGDDYARYCGLLEREATERQTRRDYGEWCAENRADLTVAWPPPRNSRCWCGSDRKYKKCCGSPAVAP